LRWLVNYAELKEFLLSFKGSSLTFPFDEKTAVFKVGGKMFALSGTDKKPLAVNLKCDPDDAQVLRSQFEAITPGYHMNKEHWNTVLLDESLDKGLTQKLIEDSYRLVISTLSLKKRQELSF
jgi:predicted DNA-binding protein (MmcQ/YjbR family)